MICRVALVILKDPNTALPVPCVLLAPTTTPGSSHVQVICLYKDALCRATHKHLLYSFGSMGECVLLIGGEVGRELGMKAAEINVR